jgi:hypothetical protein
MTRRMNRRAPLSRMSPAIVLMLGAVAFAQQPAGSAHADATDPAFQSAVLLLRQATDASDRGNAHLMLRALRHLQDPALRPIFATLADRPEPLLRVHGLLGLAETDPHRRLDLGRLAAIRDEMVLGQVVGAALDDGLLGLEQTRQMLAWADLPLSVKVVLATRLVSAAPLDDPAADAQARAALKTMLRRAAATGPLGQRGLAAMLLVQLQDEQAMDLLTAVDRSDDPQRTIVRTTLLKTAMRLDYPRIGPWALWVSTEQTEPMRLRLLALQVALRFRTPGSFDAWQGAWRQYDDDPALHRRLAVLALQVAPWADPAIYDLLDDPARRADPLLPAIARAGRAIADTRQSHTEMTAALAELAAMRQTIVNAWLITWAEKHAPHDVAAPTLGAIIAAAVGPPLGQAERLEQAIEAARALGQIDDAPRIADVLAAHRGLLAAEPDLLAAVLLGFVRAADGRTHALASMLPDSDQSLIRGLRVLLDARDRLDRRFETQPLEPDDLRRLALLLRGGGSFDQTLRLHGAWLYLRHTQQTAPAFNTLLGPHWVRSTELTRNASPPPTP